jgi:hypothetical protein
VLSLSSPSQQTTHLAGANWVVVIDTAAKFRLTAVFYKDGIEVNFRIRLIHFS